MSHCAIHGGHQGFQCPQCWKSAGGGALAADAAGKSVTVTAVGPDPIQILKDYIRLKLDQEDWHAIRDACVDIEILKAKK